VLTDCVVQRTCTEEMAKKDALPQWPAWDERAIQLAIAVARLAPAAAAPAAAAPAPALDLMCELLRSPAEEDGEEDPATSERLLALLAARGVAHTSLRHEPTRTSAESAAVRGATLASGAKALFMKSSKPLEHGGLYVLAVMSAARRADLSALKKGLGVKTLSMAPAGDVWAVTGCRPGAVPPFGSLWPGVRTVMDPSLVEQGGSINFNAGLRSLSVSMGVGDWVALQAPTTVSFTTAGE
jgi:Ala-tRNA(Pro) deacylase